MNDILELSDALLVEKYLQKRDSKYIGILLRRYESVINKGIRSVLMSRNFDQDVAAEIRDEAFQNSCVKVMEKIDQLRNPESFSFWLRAISVSTTKNEVHKRLRNEIKQEDIAELREHEFISPPDPEPNVELELLQILAKTLSPKLRKTLDLYLEGKTHREMAKILGISEGSATQYVFRMKDELKVSWERCKRC